MVDDPCRAVQDRLAAFRRPPERITVGEVAGDDLDAGQGAQSYGVPAGADQGADLMALAQGTVDQVPAQESGCSGDQDLHSARHQVAP